MVQRYRPVRKRPLYAYNRVVIGWYTDEKGRRRPITASRGYRRRRSFTIFYKPIVTSISKSVLQGSFKALAYSTPTLREIWLAFEAANIIYTHWKLIKKCYKSYEKGNLKEVVKIVGKEIFSEALLSKEFAIIWNVINGYIPNGRREVIKTLLSKIMGELTEEEIDFVARHLE